jgi:hypothetical protein
VLAVAADLCLLCVYEANVLRRPQAPHVPLGERARLFLGGSAGGCWTPARIAPGAAFLVLAACVSALREAPALPACRSRAQGQLRFPGLPALRSRLPSMDLAEADRMAAGWLGHLRAAFVGGKPKISIHSTAKKATRRAGDRARPSLKRCP